MAGLGQSRHDVVEAGGEGFDVAGVNGGEQTDSELVTAQTAVTESVDDAVCQQHVIDRVGAYCVGEVDGGNDLAPLLQVLDERAGEVAALSPRVHDLGRLRTAAGGPGQTTVFG